MTCQDDDERKYSLYNEITQEIIDEKSFKEVKDRINYLEEQLLVEVGIEKKLQIKDDIKQIQQYIKGAKKSPFSVAKFKERTKENMRTNLQKRIKTALNKIYKEVPEIGKFLIKVNHKKTKGTKDIQGTIKMGHTCWYKPDPSNPAKWVLDPEE